MIQDEARATIAEIFANEGEPAFRELEARLLPGTLRRALWWRWAVAR